MKKIICLALSLMLVFSAIGVMAAEPGMNNFKTKNTYSVSVYTDVPATEWYNVSVKKCYELALMLGNGDGKFNPDGDVTLAEAITMAARVYNIYNGGDGSLDTSAGAKWYEGIVNYAVSKNIIKASDFTNYERAATRAEMAYIFSGAMPAGEYNIINEKISAPDVKNTEKFSGEILKLYKAGIVVGSDEAHNFFPASNIKRSEAAAIICRVVDKSQRIKIEIKQSENTDSGNAYDQGEDFFEDNYEEDFYETEDDYVPEEEISDEKLFEDATEEKWVGVLDETFGAPASKYIADYKYAKDRLYIAFKGDFASKSMDLSKLRIGYANIDWTTEDLFFIGRDVNLQSDYEKRNSRNDITGSGQYFAIQRKLEGEDFVIIEIYLTESDARAVQGIEKFEQAGTNVADQIVVAAENGFCQGFEPTYIIIDSINKKVEINNFNDIPGDIKFYADENGNKTTGSGLKPILLFEDYVSILMQCNSITFETKQGKKTVNIGMTELKNGIDL